jgi:hypothetical protein
MSIYQGARLRTDRFPAATLEATRPAVSRPAVSRPSAPATHGNRRATILVGLVVAVTVVAFVYLTQTLGANASSAEINKLANDRARYEQQLLTQRVAIGRRVAVGAIEEWAVANGLSELDDPLVVELP